MTLRTFLAIWLMRVLIAEYVLVALAWAWAGDWPRAGYFAAATGISVAVLFMK